MTGLILTPATIIVPELLKIARAVHRSRDYCIVRNYVIAAMHNDGLTEAEIAGKSLQTAPPTQEPAKQPQPKPDAATNQIAKLFAENLELRVKLAELEEKLRKQTAECAALNSELDFCYHRIEVLEQVRDTEVAA